MKWSLSELRFTGEKPLNFEETLNLEQALQKRNPELIAVSPIEVSGFFTVDEMGTMLYARVKVTLTLPSTRSFQPVDLPLDFDLTEHYISHFDRQRLAEFGDNDVALVLEDDLIDLDQVVLDNILLQIPMQVLTNDEQQATEATLPTGNDWQIVTEDQVKKKQEESPKIDPRLAKLQDFFEKNDEKSDV
ncbi:YceD family protein [Ligilactobacillus ceti]|uniref:Nucleic acid-binding protein n=1 Tax=Ligilactobacillus ceti DSM 22408 TaxID=1122146 RepID=A0A0R2KN11_9LACO|nr:YceD family protein [Ligilactobacillus ceti]KRN88540.1 hypothetical protein IV53_GL000504 [Ligilactobacillus ceti DSM 22408]